MQKIVLAEKSAEAPVALEKQGLFRLGWFYGRWVYRFRWPILAFWALILALSLPFARQLSNVLLGSGFFVSSSESAHVSDLMVAKLHISPRPLLVLFHSQNTPAGNNAYRKEVSDFIQRARSFDGVSDVLPSDPGKDGRTIMVTVNFAISSNDIVEHKIPEFRKLLPTQGPATVSLTGIPAIEQGITETSQNDVDHAELLAVPVILLLLLLVFGTVVSAMTPLLLALFCVPTTLAVLYVIALHVPTNTFVLNIVSCLGLGVSIDYSLILIRRFREERIQRTSTQEAVAWTVMTAGRAVLFSGLVVIVSCLALLTIGLPFIDSFGLGGAIVVAVAVLTTLTLLPALLGVLGSRIDALPIPGLSRFTVASRMAPDRQSFWHGWATQVMRRPLVITIVVTVLLIELGWPLLSINIGTPAVDELPAQAEPRQTLQLLQREYPTLSISPIIIAVQTPDESNILAPANFAKLESLITWIALRSHVTGIAGVVRPLSEQPGAGTLQYAQLYGPGADVQAPALQKEVEHVNAGDTLLLLVQTNAPVDSPAGKALIDNLRTRHAAAVQHLRMFVGGLQASNLDFNRYLYDNFPRAIIAIVVATYVLLLMMFRSLLLPLKAIIMNILSMGATYGMLVFIFQWGYLHTLLGFTPNGTISDITPILLFCILSGISTDYEVFLLSRTHEEWLSTHDNRASVALGLEKTAGVITSAALTFIIVTGAFSLTSLLTVREIGSGITLALFVDATIIRILLVPATMSLLGRWNWWLPGWKTRTENSPLSQSSVV